jgi:hypothetical protein
MTDEKLIVELSRDLKIAQEMADRYHNYWQLELEKRIDLEKKLAECTENLKWANDNLDFANTKLHTVK